MIPRLIYMEISAGKGVEEKGKVNQKDLHFNEAKAAMNQECRSGELEGLSP